MTSPTVTATPEPQNLIDGYTPFNMAAYCISAAARSQPGKPALIVVADPAASRWGECWSFADLERSVLALASGLRSKGLERGDRVMIRLENTSTYALLFFAVIAAGGVALPTSAQLTEGEADFLLRDSGARFLALADNLTMGSLPSGVSVLSSAEIQRLMGVDPLEGYAPTRADDPAYLIYTSGTTASPKGVLHAQRAAWGRRPMYRGWYGITSADRMLHAGAFNWTYTLGTGLTDPWANGASAVIYTGEKDPALWPRLIENTGATLFAAVPGLVRQVLKYGRPDRSRLGVLRHAMIAGETPPAGLFEEWEGVTGRPLYEALGMSEISTYVSTGPFVTRKPGTIGKPQAGRRIAILPVESGDDPLPPGEEGLLAVHRSDPGLMLGYWKRPAEEAEVLRGEWFTGGDLATIDSEGYVAHRGRANDIMKALGYRVSPLEVEAALGRHPAVAEAACAEVRVRSDVSVIGAFVVPKPGAAIDADELGRFAHQVLAEYKTPRAYYIVAELPRTANGKVRRTALADLARGMANRGISTS